MKKVVCFIVLVLAIGGISFLTIYTLNHKEIRKDVKEKVASKIEIVTTNMTTNSLSEIYNIYLNKQRHKLKLEYNIIFNTVDGLATGNLILYIDGGKVIEESVINNISVTNINDLFNEENVSKYVRIDMNNIEIMNINDDEYLLIKLGIVNKDKSKEKYYLINKDGDIVIKHGLVIRDDEEYLVNSDGEELDVFYDTLEQIRVKIEDNNIYALELEEKETDKDTEKELILNEYKYSFDKKKLKKELIKSIEDVKIK